MKAIYLTFIDMFLDLYNTGYIYSQYKCSNKHVFGGKATINSHCIGLINIITLYRSNKHYHTA